MIFFRIINVSIHAFLLLICFLIPKSKIKYEFILSLIKNLGGVYVKCLQFIATRGDMFSDGFDKILKSIQDNAKPIKTSIFKNIIKKELGDFKSINLTQDLKKYPIGVGSIAQVNTANIVGIGEVAIKIVKPNAKRQITQDLKVIKFIGFLFGKISKFKRLKIPDLIDEFSGITYDEMSMNIEKSNLETFINNKDVDGVMFPKIVEDYCTDKILVMEYVKGHRVDSDFVSNLSKAQKKMCMERFAKSIFFQIFRDGFFHGDLHQGNLLIKQNLVLSYIDFGMVGKISKRNRLFVVELLYSLMMGNYRRASEIHFEYGIVGDEFNISDFADELEKVAKPLFKSKKDVSMGELLKDLFDITARYNMETQVDLALLQKTFIMIEGIAKSIDKDANIWLVMIDDIRKWMGTNLGLFSKIFN